jgi:hypothetical protein
MAEIRTFGAFRLKSPESNGRQRKMRRGSRKKTERKMWKTMSRWKGNIKLGLREIGGVGGEWMDKCDL